MPTRKEQRTGGAAPRVFISYSHEDTVFRDQLLTHLRVLERQGIIEPWDTGSIAAGADWSEEIADAISESKLAVLLVSPSFLASDFIANRELPTLLERHRNEGLVLLPVLIRPTSWTGMPGLAELQFANNPQRPVSVIDSAERDSVYASVAQRIAELAQAVSERDTATGAPRAPVDSSSGADRTHASEKNHIFVSHCHEDGDFAELLKLRLERESLDAWVDSDRLEPGLDWRVEIDDALKNAFAVLAVMSPEARASEYVTYEWAYAWGCGRKVIPIMLRQTTIHPRLAALQYLDFTNRIARPWTRLVASLNGRPAASHSERPRRVPKRKGGG